MFGLIVFVAVVVALIAMLGSPYQQSWYSRWGKWDR